MPKAGQGFSRRVTKGNLDSFAALLRKVVAPGAAGGAEVPVPSTPPADPDREAAEAQFRGVPIATRFPFRPIRGGDAAGPRRPPRRRQRPAATGQVPPAVPLPPWRRVWEKHNLRERDLNIPTGGTTNPTGSMTLGRGAWEMDDLRHYFRDVAFSGLHWRRDTAFPYREIAEAPFEIVVDGRVLGRFQLTVVHDTRTDTASYRQHNASTHLRWNRARPLIARRELLGHRLELYRDDSQGEPIFRLEIRV